MESILARFRRPTPKPYSTPGMAGPDIISRLPYELREMILAELSLEDISGALSVCRTWRCSWLDDGAWLSLADRWFPGLAERIRISTGADGGDAATAAAAAAAAAEAAEMFRRALHRIQRRTSGKFASAFQHTMCLECERFFELDKSLPVAEGGVHQFEGLQFSGISTRFPRFMMYNSGRIAWWPEMYGSPFFAIVDDLCTKMRRAYLFPNNGGFRQGYKTAISSRLFVMCRGTTVDAWHFTLNCLRSVEIPEEFDRCIAEGERILLISNNGRIYSWTFGQDVLPIDAHQLGFYPIGRVLMGGLEDFTYRFSSHHIGLRFRDSGILIDFIIHPLMSNVFFIIMLGSDAPRKLIVHEIHKSELVGSYSLDHYLIKASNIGDIGYLRWEKIDSYGGYCLAHAWLEDLNPHTSDNTTKPDTPLTGCSPGCSMRGLVSFCFNIYTKQFTILHHRIAKNAPSVHHLWNGQVITNNYDGQPGSVTEGLILSIRSCSSSQVGSSDDTSIPLYTATPEKDGTLQRRYKVDLATKDLQGSGDARFAFNPHQRFGTHRNWASEYGGVKRLVGDDDFLLFVDGGNYTAWSFGNDIPEQPLDDGQMRWWKKLR